MTSTPLVSTPLVSTAKQDTIPIVLSERLEINWYDLINRLARTLRRDPQLVMNWSRYKRIREQSYVPETPSLERDRHILSYLRRAVFIGMYHLIRVHLWLLDAAPEPQDETVLWTMMIHDVATRVRVCSMVAISIDDTLLYSGKTFQTLDDIKSRRDTLKARIRGFYASYLSSNKANTIAQQPLHLNAPVSLRPIDNDAQQLTQLTKMSFDACDYNGDWSGIKWRDNASNRVLNACLEQVRIVRPPNGNIGQLVDTWIGTDWEQVIAESLDTSIQTIYCVAVALECGVSGARRRNKDMVSILSAERMKYLTRLAYRLVSSPTSPSLFIEASKPPYTPRGMTPPNPWLQPEPAPYRPSFDLIKLIENK